MFELSVALKYLIPQRKQLSLSIISIVSVLVISLVVWLVLVFLSVTEGMEKNWIEKLVSLNGPLHLVPTEQYFQSYYYQVDGISSSSNYQLKTLHEKLNAHHSHPYDPNIDSEIPSHWPPPHIDEEGQLIDLVKEIQSLVLNLKPHYPSLSFSAYEHALGSSTIQLRRKSKSSLPYLKTSFSSQLSQSGIIQSFNPHSPLLHKHLIPPTLKDLNNFLTQNASKLSFPYLSTLFTLEALSPPLGGWPLPVEELPPNESFEAIWVESPFPQVFIPLSKKEKESLEKLYPKHQLGSYVKSRGFYPSSSPSSSIPLPPEGPLLASTAVLCANLSPSDPAIPPQARLYFNLQSQPIEILTSLLQFDIAKAKLNTHFNSPPSYPLPWPYTLKQERIFPDSDEEPIPIFFPKAFKDKGALVGDKGHIYFQSNSLGSSQEQKLSVTVAGFFDPGLAPMGNRTLLAPLSLTHLINNLSNIFPADRIEGLRIDITDLQQIKTLKHELIQALEKKGIADYWKIESFYDYEFSKDFIQQLQSDKTLLTLIAIIIIIVACSNIVSMLILLVNDKKTEIAILQSMGASPRSIAFIFGFSGLSLGLAGCLLGTLAALLTLSHFEVIVAILSSIQGHNAFNAAYYGENLPSELSQSALLFVLSTTSILSLVAGVIPAVKASLVKPSVILKS